MGALSKYIITVESNVPPQIFLGADIGGATVIGMQQEKVELVSAAWLAERYSISVDSVRRKCAAINQGTTGKALYNPKLADAILKNEVKSKRGARRKN